ncbi:MAG: hypothetical protein RQ750_05410 [Roseovarius sp.]|nr:hypothetical protein [Roseovarius sp.]
MFIRAASLALIADLLVIPAFAGPSGQHSAQSVGHSAQGASHGSAAVSTGAASVAAVPIFAFGSVLAVTGAALEEVGEGSLVLGNDLSRVGTGQPVQTGRVTPNGAPVLD